MKLRQHIQVNDGLYATAEKIVKALDELGRGKRNYCGLFNSVPTLTHAFQRDVVMQQCYELEKRIECRNEDYIKYAIHQIHLDWQEKIKQMLPKEQRKFDNLLALTKNISAELSHETEKKRKPTDPLPALPIVEIKNHFVRGIRC